jgi:2-haloacid dehalogenase
MPIDTSTLKYVSFDCYGTLIDWESGIVDAVRRVLTARGLTATPEAIIQAHARIERNEEAKPYRPYREVLTETMAQMAQEFGFTATAEEKNALVDSLPNWRPFPDTVSALRALHTRYRLVVLSNIDRDLFAATARHLGVDFDFVITAEDVSAYKPDPNHFRTMLSRTGATPREHLHAAASLFHDIAPANLLKIPSAWIHRSPRSEFHFNARGGERPSATVVVPNLAELARLLGCPGPGGGVYQ